MCNFALYMRRSLLNIITLIITIATPFLSRGQLNTEQMLKVGQNALYFEDYVLSIQYFNQIIAVKPYLAQPYVLRAIAKYNLEDFAGAASDASTALSINPFLPDAWEVKGVANQNIGNSEIAIECYDKALELLPRNRQIMFNKALALSDVKSYEAADSTYKQLLEAYPNFDNGYIGRAKNYLAKGDTLAASADIDKALEINPNAFNGYVLRSTISIERKSDYKQALEDMDKAIKLAPRYAGLYINRAFLRYSLDDYFGAMADYDYALELEPMNETALFNRSLLLIEVTDYEKAISDLNKILMLNPNQERAHFNRAVSYANIGNYDKAIEDLDAVISIVPELSSAYFLRSEYYREKGNMKKAEADYKKGMAIAKTTPSEIEIEEENEISPEVAARRFNALITIENDATINEEYNNTAIRGRVQDKSIDIELQPLIELSYYSSPNELSNNVYYIKDVDDINATRLLRFIIMVVSNPLSLSDSELIGRHFDSIEYYNSYLSTHQPRAIDYIGRAMDFITVKNYDAAIEDLDKAISLTPNQPVAYMLRAQARYHNRQPNMPNAQHTQLMMILDDINHAIDISPRMAPVWFNKGNLLYELGDYTSAIASYTKAIELSAAMGEAYYNRGFIYLKMGNQNAGIADLSKAGELGIIPAYNLLKRLNQ